MSASSASVRVVTVVVTWNRRDLLEEVLAAVAGQSHEPAAVVVVDNASTDGTAALLGQWSDLDVVSLTENTGGAGGFAAGIQQALTHHPDLLWLLDDDTVPGRESCAELVRAWAAYDPHGPRPRLVASRVVWTDGRDHPMNTPRRAPGASRGAIALAAAVGCVPIRSASFVSVICDAAVVRERGLPVADYFLWNDDFEYSTRLVRGGVGLYCRASEVVHKTKRFGATDADPGERFFYEVRNKVWVLTRSTSLSPPEKAVYAASTVRRWARTALRSRDRPTLARAFWSGVGAGVGHGPRTDAEVLRRAGWTGPRRSACPEGARPGSPIAFSLLMAVYAGDDPGQFRRAFTSSVHEQILRPDEVVLVRDGPVADAFAAAMEEMVRTSPVPVHTVLLEQNQGLGPALDAGLRACTHEVVARMDADDVSLPERFARQLPVIEAGADLVGAGMLEFSRDPCDPSDVVGRRTPPEDPDEIRRVIRFRDPFNHPTVVYRRTAVLGAGGYTDLALMEDYLLFTRMVQGGAQPANLAEPLLCYRVGEGAYARRGGRSLLRSELSLQRRLRVLGITTRGQYVRNVVVRGGYRLVPERVRKVAYRRLLANRAAGRLR